MRKSEKEIIERLVKEDGDFKKLYEEHKDMEKELRRYDQKAYLTTQEEIEVKKLKKLKLLRKDSMQKKINQCRQDPSG